MSFSTAVYDSNGSLMRLTLNSEDKYRLFTPLSSIPSHLIKATLLQEDQYFYQHYGINPFAIVHAAWQTWGRQSRRIGASTITMQVARLRFGIHSKTLSGKLLQIARAIQLEWHYSKNEILEAYFNLAPYGGNIEGASAASLIYFHKSLDKLSLSDALILSIIPQNPLKRTPNNPHIQSIRDKLFARWLRIYPDDAYQKAAMALPIVMYSLHSLPFAAPHFVNQIVKDPSNTSSKEIITTLDLRLQNTIEHITKQYIRRKRALGVFNAAVLLVDSRDMSIQGMMGSADFFNHSISGQINGTEIKRSPGSTLKPFIYALAFDQGIIHPATVLKDVPHSFGGYNPDNFDYDFMGPIKARDALLLSRNIPAVYLASQLKGLNLYQLLVQAEISHLKSDSFYGLSLALGGAELSMQELSGLYAMLANEGVWRPLRMKKNEPIRAGKRLLSPEASFLVWDILKETAKPDGSNINTHQSIPVSWKTGTSSGYRDAWTVGIFGPYVLTVWIGHFDNKSNPTFIGKTIAAPLFFELVNAITHERSPMPEINNNPIGMNLVQVEVCRASGMLPTRYCHDTDMSWFIPGKSPIHTDTIYREVAIDSTTGLRTCHFDDNTRFEIYEFWPSDLLAIFKQAGIQRRIPPFYDAKCALKSSASLKPQITSPQTESHYILRINTLSARTIPFTAVTDAEVKTVYWFANDTYLGNSLAPDAFLWTAKPGNFIIRVVDDHGLSDAKDIRVEMAN